MMRFNFDMGWQRGVLLTVATAFVLLLAGLAAADSTDNKLSDADQVFLEKVQPLLTSRCITCHGTEKAEGGLRLDSREAILKGGDSGPAFVPGKPDESLLLSAVRATHEELKMPPKDKLPAKDIALLERWIEDGAPWPSVPASPNTHTVTSSKHIGDAWTDPDNPITRLWGGERLDLWSLKPVQRPAIPTTQQKDWSKGDVDQFVLARLEQDKVTPPPSADARTLARRLYYDLTGLPPTPQQVADFEKAIKNNGDDAATSVLVESLLASPRFGEHFGRLWLDVIRYSDSNGFDWDEFRPQAWRFRDYVVRSLNADKPFDQFIREQLAGDELIGGTPKTTAEQDCLIATGYLRLGPHDNAAKLFDEQDRSRAELLADVTETTAGGFLGLTLTCCRCHDHKYDPISQADHYRFRAFFAAMQFADDRPLDLADEQAKINEHNRQLDEEEKPLRKELKAISKKDGPAREHLQKQIDELEQKKTPATFALLMTDSTENVPITRVLFLGDHKLERDAVEPGFLSVYDPQPATISKSDNAGTTGRRLTLANWIASPNNPLTARVFVNRIWQDLMGRPLVATPNDFGLAGARPEDAALLDWLASEFVRNGWSVKQLVRQIATSATYRQAPSFTGDLFALRLPRRLRAEQLRDSILLVSGLLTAKDCGPPVWPELPPEVLASNPSFLDDNKEKTKGWYPSPQAEQYCRTLFLVQKRNTRVPLLETFDLPDNSTSCAFRQVSTVAPQALALLNSSLSADAARAFAERVKREAGDKPTDQVRHAFELTLERTPDAAEAEACEKLLVERNLVELCRALINLNEFVYVD